MNTKDLLSKSKILNLLYVEDEVSIRESSYEFFANYFNSITVCNDGAQAIKAYEKSHYDIIITDILMPVMNGIDLISYIREHNKKIPILVYSAIDNLSSMSACIDLNVDGYINKPIKSTTFMEVLKRCIIQLEYDKNNSSDENSIFNDIQKEFNYDGLTGLQSHNKLLEAIESVDENSFPVVILVNIDEFHTYNELYGLSIGDKLLVEFAKLLDNFSKEKDYSLFRISGDEFVLYERVTMIDPESYEEDLEVLFEYLESSKVSIEDIKEPIYFSITAGLSFSKENSYARAEMALQEARKRGRRYLGYSTESDTRSLLAKKMYWREEINCAIDENRVEILYQPVIDKNKNISRYESLMRIKQIQDDGTLKYIAPSEFLDFSKISRQYISLTTIMIEESFKTMLDKNVHISLNLTFHDIANREINKLLHKQISKHKVAIRTNFDINAEVVFELLENPNHSDYDMFVDFINDFKEQGVIITIDNFGLGFSNMSQMASLAPHYVKIDSSLIKHIVDDNHSFRLVKAIVQFAKELRIKTIAEHVLNEEVFLKCLELDIDEFQGYYFSQPVGKDTIQVKYE